MNGASLKDLGLLWPELILVGAALALILAGRRISKAPWVTAATVLAALLAALASVWLWSGSVEAGIWRHDHGGRILPIL